MASFTANVAENVIVREAVRGSRGAINVNGTSDTMRFTHPASPNAITASMWFRIGTDLNYYSGLWSIEASSSTYLQFGLALNGTTLICNDLSQERTIQACSVGTWYFASFSIDSSGNVKMFVGTEGGTLTKYTTTLTNYTAPINEARIGGTSYGEYIDGRIANYKQWDAVLSDAEVHAEFYSDAPVRTSNLVGWYPLENTTNKLEDYNGSNDLTNPGSGSFSFGAGPDIPRAKQEYLNEEVYNLPAEAVGEVYTPGSGGSYTGDVNETVTVSESAAAIRGAIAGLSETVTLSESAAAIRGAIAGLSETVSVSDATAAAYSAIVGPSETVTLSESSSTQSDEASALAESVSLSEAVAAGTAYSAGPSETVSVSDAVGAVRGAIAGLSETVTTGESTAAVYGAVVAPAESVSVSEAVSSGGSTNYPESVSDTVSLSEALGVVYSPVVASAETVFVSIPAMGELASTDLHLVAEDWTPGSSWVSRVGGFTASLNGSLQKKSAPNIERNEIYGFTTNDHFTLAANPAHDVSDSLNATWEFLVRTTATGGILMGWDPYPVAGGYDFAQYGAGALFGVVNDSLGDYYRVNAGGISFGADYSLITFVLDNANDEMSIYVNGVLDQTVSGHTGTLTSSTAGNVFIGNSNGNDQPYDGGIIEVLRHRVALKPGEVSARAALYGKNRIQPSRSTSGTASETVSVSDAAAGAYSARPSVADTLTLSDATTLAQVLGQGLSETVSLSEATTALAALARSLAETISLAESVLSSISGAGGTVSLSETVALAEAVALAQVLANALTETVTLAEAMIGYVPRVLVTELGEPTAVKTAAAMMAPVVAVETDQPTAVKAATTTLVGLP